MRKVLFGLVLSMFTASAMAASWLLEPYVGYSSISGDKNNADIEASGIQFGGRLGYNFAVVSVGAQYDMTSITGLKYSNGNSTEGEGTASNLGAFILASLPVAGLRVWGTYFFNAEIEGTKTGGPIGDNTNWGGNAIGLGVGYKLPAVPVAINVEYRKSTYDKKDLEPNGEVNATAITGTLSIPLTF